MVYIFFISLAGGAELKLPKNFASQKYAHDYVDD